MTRASGPRGPALWQTLRAITHPIRFLEASAARYGDPFVARVLGHNSPPVVFAGTPDAIRAIFEAPADCFELGRLTHVFTPLTGDRSLVRLDGERHRQRRQLLAPPLHGERLYRHGPFICQTTQAIAARLPRQGDWRLRPWMAAITLPVILRVALGRTQGARCERMQSLLERVLAVTAHPLYSTLFFFPPLQRDWGRWSPWGHFVRLRQQLDALLYAEIAERRASGGDGGDDALSMLLAAQDTNGNPLTDTELRDQLMTLLLLGHETTASSLAWALRWIHALPAIERCLRQELAQLGPQPDPSAIAALPYLDAVCRETLRIHPVALIAQPRVLAQPFPLQGVTYPPGAVLVPCIQLAHRRAAAFPQPERFRPERFWGEGPAPYTYLPFGGGARACLGAALSLYEMKLAITTLLSHVQLELREPAAAHPVRRGITMVPAGSVRMAVRA